ncbi:MAG: putative transporter [Dysgonamonadaceae bacterium]|jgi:putative transport protein|nr:putative transporter [Dysgonamonadaceae bacterium]
MNWITELFIGRGMAHTVFLYALVIAIGIGLGKIKVFGVSLGIAFVLFAGILAGHLGLKVNHEILHFTKDFGMILFVYSIGLQVGPGFFSSFKTGGITLNMLAISTVLLGIAITIIIHFVQDVPMQTMVGIMSGAVTNTPGLGAAQQAFYDISGTTDSSIASGYALTYPLAVVGIIISFLLLRFFFGIKQEKELEHLIEMSGSDREAFELISIEVKNTAVSGKSIGEIHHLISRKFVISRILRVNTGVVEIASSKTTLNEGDKIYVATTAADKDAIQAFLGIPISMHPYEWELLDSHFVSRRILITRPEINGKRITDLNFRSNFGVNITHVNRSGIDLVADPHLSLRVGDRVTVVGEANSILNVEKILGNQMRRLNEPNLAAIFVGIFLGVLLANIPLTIPGIPQPVKLGLSGGPLIIAILVGAFGPKNHLVTYTTTSASLMLRELSICLFLVSVGIEAGETFVTTIINGGYAWIGYGIIITIIPMLVVGTVGRLVFKLNYFTLMGLLAGSTTDSPALAYANDSAENDAPSVAYATVYPLTTFLRVIGAQLLILFFV